MSLWWLQPGWANASCGMCGAHIQRSGGDPDWGLCWPCMQAQTERNQSERRMYAEQEAAYYAEMAGAEEYDSWQTAFHPDRT